MKFRCWNYRISKKMFLDFEVSVTGVQTNRCDMTEDKPWPDSETFWRAKVVPEIKTSQT
jgi:hypothetical protein